MSTQHATGAPSGATSASDQTNGDTVLIPGDLVEHLVAAAYYEIGSRAQSVGHDPIMTADELAEREADALDQIIDLRNGIDELDAVRVLPRGQDGRLGRLLVERLANAAADTDLSYLQDLRVGGRDEAARAVVLATRYERLLKLAEEAGAARADVEAMEGRR